MSLIKSQDAIWDAPSINSNQLQALDELGLRRVCVFGEAREVHRPEDVGGRHGQLPDHDGSDALRRVDYVGAVIPRTAIDAQEARRCLHGARRHALPRHLLREAAPNPA